MPLRGVLSLRRNRDARNALWATGRVTLPRDRNPAPWNRDALKRLDNSRTDTTEQLFNCPAVAVVSVKQWYQLSSLRVVGRNREQCRRRGRRRYAGTQQGRAGVRLPLVRPAPGRRRCRGGRPHRLHSIAIDSGRCGQGRNTDARERVPQNALWATMDAPA